MFVKTLVITLAVFYTAECFQIEDLARSLENALMNRDAINHDIEHNHVLPVKTVESNEGEIHNHDEVHSHEDAHHHEEHVHEDATFEEMDHESKLTEELVEKKISAILEEKEQRDREIDEFANEVIKMSENDMLSDEEIGQKWRLIEKMRVKNERDSEKAIEAIFKEHSEHFERNNIEKLEVEPVVGDAMDQIKSQIKQEAAQSLTSRIGESKKMSFTRKELEELMAVVRHEIEHSATRSIDTVLERGADIVHRLLENSDMRLTVEQVLRNILQKIYPHGLENERLELPDHLIEVLRREMRHEAGHEIENSFKTIHHTVLKIVANDKKHGRDLVSNVILEKMNPSIKSVDFN